MQRRDKQEEHGLERARDRCGESAGLGGRNGARRNQNIVALDHSNESWSQEGLSRKQNLRALLDEVAAQPRRGARPGGPEHIAFGGSEAMDAPMMMEARPVAAPKTAPMAPTGRNGS